MTVDTYSCKVYQGLVSELMDLRKKRDVCMKGTPVYQTLRRISDWIVPLNLVDPKGPDFTSRGCRTLHDVTRFAHERSYTYMFQISDTVSEKGTGALKLDSPVALDLFIIDVGGGLKDVKMDARRYPSSRLDPFLSWRCSRDSAIPFSRNAGRGQSI